MKVEFISREWEQIDPGFLIRRKIMYQRDKNRYIIFRQIKNPGSIPSCIPIETWLIFKLISIQKCMFLSLLYTIFHQNKPKYTEFKHVNGTVRLLTIKQFSQYIS